MESPANVRFSPTARPAGPADCEKIAQIYNEGIAERRSTFETGERSATDIAGWIDSPAHPVLVAESADGGVAGWARIASYSARPCYARIGEASVYVSAAVRKQGIGGALARALRVAAEGAGYHKLIGKLIAGNAASEALALRHGFRVVGTHVRHGVLDGRWHDVLLIELLLDSEI